MDEVEFPLSERVRRGRRWLLTAGAVCAVLATVTLVVVVAAATDWFEVSRALVASLIAAAVLVLPVVWVGARAVWALRGRTELFAAADAYRRRRPTDRQMLDHLRDEHPFTPLWWMVAILAGLAALCLGVALPFAAGAGAVLDAVLLGCGLVVALIALAAAVPGIGRAQRQGEEDHARRRRLWPVPDDLARRLAEPLLGTGDGGHIGA
ncbi:hypothetical protein [Catellatospora sichuanensis]|uniref:hypothetical protein n=1 Tax=Catellatospora sichuanensis TaxID=1969805 RepID=UPI001183E925|nr:hypothetical protein [Catellatospora sichuanensis]